MEFNQAYDPIRALQASWKALARAPLPLLLGGVLLLLTGGGGGGGGNFFSIRQHAPGIRWSEIRPFVLPFIGICGCFGIALFLFSSWVKVGFANTVEDVLRTGRGEVERLFDSKGRFGSMVLARLLCGIVSLLAAVPLLAIVAGVAIVTRGFERHEEVGLILIPAFLLWLPAFLYVVLGIWLADQAVALEGAQPVDSLKRSWSLVAGHRWMLLLYVIVGIIFAAVGICLCCIGVFLTGSMVEIARSESYLALVRTDRPSWWVERGEAPPSPPQGWGAPPPPPSPPTPAVPA